MTFHNNRNTRKGAKMIKRQSLSFLLILLVLTTGCSQPPQSGKRISAMDMIDYAEDKEKMEIEQIRLTKKEEFDRHYANGLYLEDLSIERESFDKAYVEMMESELKQATSYPLFIDSEMEFYNASLKQARDGNLKFEDILTNTGEHIRKARVSLYVFYDLEDHKVNTDSIDEVMRKWWQKHLNDGVVDVEFRWYAFEPEVLEIYSIEELKEVEYSLTQLAESGTYCGREQYLITGEESYSDEFPYDYPFRDEDEYEE